MKNRFFVVTAGISAVLILFFFGKTSKVKSPDAVVKDEVHNSKSFDIQAFIETKKLTFTAEEIVYLSKLENGITRGDVIAQQQKAYTSLAVYWKDTLKTFEPYAWYTAEAAKLDKSQKNLTFAARLFLESIRSDHDESTLEWKTSEAIGLFEEALKKDPENADLRIDLGSCYIFGRGQNPMQGIEQILGVVRKDSTNMKAQLMLGVGGIVSRQYDRAVARLKKVVAAEPNNTEAVAYLADAFAGNGQREEAIKWYNLSKRMVNDPHYSQEADERIKALR